MWRLSCCTLLPCSVLTVLDYFAVSCQSLNIDALCLILSEMLYLKEPKAFDIYTLILKDESVERLYSLLLSPKSISWSVSQYFPTSQASLFFEFLKYRQQLMCMFRQLPLIHRSVFKSFIYLFFKNWKLYFVYITRTMKYAKALFVLVFLITGMFYSSWKSHIQYNIH